VIGVGERREMIDVMGWRERQAGMECSRINQMNVDGESMLRPQYIAFTLTNWKESSA
jgi:hypothetical protein